MQSSGAVWKSRWSSWAPVPNKPAVSVDVKQHFNNVCMYGHVCLHRFDQLSDPMLKTTAAKCNARSNHSKCGNESAVSFQIWRFVVFYLTWRFQITRGDRFRLDPSMFLISRGGRLWLHQNKFSFNTRLASSFTWVSFSFNTHLASGFIRIGLMFNTLGFKKKIVVLGLTRLGLRWNVSFFQARPKEVSDLNTGFI